MRVFRGAIRILWLGLMAGAAALRASYGERGGLPALAEALLFGGVIIGAMDLLLGHLQRSRVQRAPGALLEDSLEYFCSKKSVASKVLRQGIADMREEYIAALQGDRLWLARIIYLRWCLSVVCTVGALGGTSLVKIVYEIWKIGR